MAIDESGNIDFQMSVEGRGNNTPTQQSFDVLFVS